MKGRVYFFFGLVLSVLSLFILGYIFQMDGQLFLASLVRWASFAMAVMVTLLAFLVSWNLSKD